MPNIYEESRKKEMNELLRKACDSVDEFKKFMKTLRELYATNKNDPLLRYGVGELRRKLLWKQDTTDSVMLNRIPDKETLDRLEDTGPIRIEERQAEIKAKQEKSA